MHMLLALQVGALGRALAWGAVALLAGQLLWH